jgi:hypothetical protein
MAVIPYRTIMNMDQLVVIVIYLITAYTPSSSYDQIKITKHILKLSKRITEILCGI